MAIIIPKYQSLFFKSLEDRTISTGSNLITNGKFTTDLSNWNIDSFVWDSTSDGIASAYRGYGIGTASLEQDGFNLQANNRYKLQFKYKASKQFKVTVMLHNNANAELSEDISFVGITDGFWHTVELYYNINIITTGRLILVAENIDAPGIQQGISFDDVSIYAQQSVVSCGDCDTVIMDSNRPIEFQVKSGKLFTSNNLFPNGNYDTNPFQSITSNNLVFDVNSHPTSGQYFTLYIADKVYIIQKTTDIIWAPFNEILTGNISDIRIYSTTLPNFNTNLLSALQATIDMRHGTTTTLTGTTFTISGIPSLSFLDDIRFSLLSNVNTVSSAVNGIATRNLIYNNLTKQLNYFRTDNVSPVYLETKVTLEAGKLYKIQFGYATVNEFNFLFNIFDSLNNNVFSDTINPLPTSYTGANVNYEFIAPYDDTFTLAFQFDASNPATDQLAFDNVSVINSEYIYDSITIQAKDCQGNLTELPYTEIPYKENVLIQVNNNDLPTNTPFQIIVNDSQSASLGLQHFSEKIELYDFNNIAACKIEKQLKIQWTDTCKFGDIDYKNLPFENEFYIRGFILRKPLDKRERIQTTNPDGSLKTIFDHSIAKVELRIATYGIGLHRVLERAVVHGSLIINGSKYYLDDAASYTPGDFSGNGLATARVDLIESGSEVIKTACCC